MIEFATPVRVTHLGKGTIFLIMEGEERRLAIITYYDNGDRAAGSVKWVTEGGQFGEDIDMGDVKTVFPLGKVNLGRNPLRDLINWAAQYGG